ncbi:cerebellar degeneration-related protein 2-like [Pseudonaja textilis]|uniref:Cerebellar degeneration-related protein 2-like n=1 Tax=Pseudonaja textilis TaxID=8673 RepID=A0A670ZJI4_PSETE|nr:cerebellar degeneration-related protein 2-like [Pseudonaja textilis]XP_026579952.1 cerebellar degeneration-related protein 2-like [Pseudonaja textilis]
MLTDSLVEEFEIREDEPWYDQQDLQQDLHLAAELGKTLLDRNTELESSLQQMYSTNQEQLQEIEYLTKQVDLLRQMNDQHAKVYEQLDVTARELEDANQKLVIDSRASQQKIGSLTETIENLQTHIDELQRQVEELKTSGQSHVNYEQPKSVQSFPCLKELYDLRKYFVYDHIFAEKIISMDSQLSPVEEENQNLKKAVTLLQTQLSVEKEKRLSMEEEYGFLLKENTDLEQQLVDIHVYQARAEELETEVAEMKQLFHSGSPCPNRMEQLAPESFFISLKEPLEKELNHGLWDGTSFILPEFEKRSLKRSSSESLLSSTAGEDLLFKGHEETCIRRAEAVKQRGVSLLNEVDAQYNALKVKYEELLQKCQRDKELLDHKAVQTSRQRPKDVHGGSVPLNGGLREPDALTADSANFSSNVSPEYKLLFKEIFSRIEETKKEIDEHRAKYKSFSSQYP